MNKNQPEPPAQPPVPGVEPGEVDPWRFLGWTLSGLISKRIESHPGHPPIPWAPVTKAIASSKVALLSTAGISSTDEPPFDMESERQRPSWGDPSWRRLRSDTTAADVEVNHLHINTEFVRRDLNVALPLDRLRELVAEGVVGSMAETHYSTMGYQGASTKALEDETAPQIAAAMRSEAVDLVLLAPV